MRTVSFFEERYLNKSKIINFQEMETNKKMGCAQVSP